MIFLRNQKYFKIYQKDSESKIRILYNYKFYNLLIIFAIFLYLLLVNNKEPTINKIIQENFFFIDSNNLNNIVPHMYGYAVSKNGILTDNYYKQLGKYQAPEPQGVYIMIRKIGNEIIINQDFYGGFGLYFYENKDKNYYALSNSFLLLLENLTGKQNISFNKEYADNLITTNLCSFSLSETLIQEIKQIPANSYLVIDIRNKKIKINSIDYQENSIPLESDKGLDIIDNWVDKWGFIIRSLKKQTDNISSDLSGGFDTRTLLSILLNSGIDIKEINVNSIRDNLHNHDIDYDIATKISNKFGFQLNKYAFDKESISLNIRDIIINTIYAKLGFHKEFYLKNKFYLKPRFSFSGSGGEALRGAPRLPIKEFIKTLSSRNILGHSEEFYNSSKRLFNRTISILKKGKFFINDYDISHELYYKILGRNHFGKSSLEGFISNFYLIQPLMDPDIKKIKFEVNKESSNDLIAYIYVRFANELINFPIQGNRSLGLESVKKAEKLNAKRIPYKIKTNYNQNFFVDRKRISPSFPSKKTHEPFSFFYSFFKSSNYINIISKLYDINVYNWANEYIEKIRYHPLSQHFALLSIAKTYDCLLSNETNINKFFNFNKKSTN